MKELEEEEGTFSGAAVQTVAMTLGLWQQVLSAGRGTQPAPAAQDFPDPETGRHQRRRP